MKMAVGRKVNRREEKTAVLTRSMRSADEEKNMPLEECSETTQIRGHDLSMVLGAHR